jgi:hypothetical protein
MAVNGKHPEHEFLHHLYNTKRITANEFKNIQTYEKIYLSSVANISEISDLTKRHSNEYVVNKIVRGQ